MHRASLVSASLHVLCNNLQLIGDDCLHRQSGVCMHAESYSVILTKAPCRLSRSIEVDWSCITASSLYRVMAPGKVCDAMRNHPPAGLADVVQDVERVEAEIHAALGLRTWPSPTTTGE